MDIILGILIVMLFGVFLFVILKNNYTDIFSKKKGAVRKAPMKLQRAEITVPQWGIRGEVLGFKPRDNEGTRGFLYIKARGRTYPIAVHRSQLKPLNEFQAITANDGAGRWKVIDFIDTTEQSKEKYKVFQDYKTAIKERDYYQQQARKLQNDLLRYRKQAVEDVQELNKSKPTWSKQS